MKCSYCHEEITDSEDLRLNQRLIERLGADAEPMHIVSGDCAAKSEIDDYARRSPNMRGHV